MDRKIKRYFVVNVPPHHLCGKYHTSYAASNFCWALINSEAFDQYYSVLPSNISGRVDDIKMEGLVYSSLRYKGVLMAKLAPFAENISIFKKIESNSSVWLYNVGILNCLLFFLIKIFKPSVRLNAILLDLAVPKKKLSLEYVVLWMMNHCDGTIRLANSELFTCRNSICMPGVVPESAEGYPEVSKVNLDFLLSGQLRDDISQTKLLINAFSKVPEVTLNISGFAVDLSDEKLRNLCKQYDNINYYGNVSFDRYLELLHKCSFLLSTRDPNIIDNKANFPSKVIEAILHNRIIVSTIYYEQLNGLKYFVIPSEEDTLVTILKKIASMSDVDLITYANQSTYAKEHFSPSKWDEAMSLIESNIKKK